MSRPRLFPSLAPGSLALAVAGSLLLGGCAETQLFSHAAKQITKPAEAPVAATRGTGIYKVGNPYQVAGSWYYPAENPDYDETGVASWYGEPFHGRLTANGEIYDQNELTAAHQTLPMPSLVRVTNLENGRSMVVKVNDRGPFVNGRIIDMSRRGAQLLGFERQGTARVRVQYVGPAGGPDGVLVADAGTAAQPEVTAAPRTEVAAESLAPPPGVAAEPTVAAGPAPAVLSSPGLPAANSAAARVTAQALESQQIVQEAVRPSSIYIQAGAFTQYDNANRLSAQLATVGPARVTTTTVGGTEYFRVRVGPLETVEQADAALGEVMSLGQRDARIVVD